MNQNNSSCNKNDHKQWSRRSFLHALGLLSGSGIALANTNLTASKPSLLSQELTNLEHDRILILCKLSGGNDGLSTIIPLDQYDIYANKRPKLRLAKNKLTTLSQDKLAMANSLNPINFLWKEGGMKIINGVGYKNSELSHEKSSAIWTHTNVEERTNDPSKPHTGWMGRAFEERYPDYVNNPPESPAALKIGGGTNDLLFRGNENQFAYTFNSVNRLEEIVKNGVLYKDTEIDTVECSSYNKYLKHVQKTSNFASKYAKTVHEAYKKSQNFGGYNSDSLSRQLAIISRLIKGNLGTKVYVISLGGFDTHANQNSRHPKLMNHIAKAIGNFHKDLEQAGWGDKVLTTVFSEFGRRVKENGTGTDHGNSGPMLLFGKGLQSSNAINDYPSLTDTDNRGNLKYKTDFRQVYATILREWLCIPEWIVQKSIYGGAHDSLELGFECENPVLGLVNNNTLAFGTKIKSRVIQNNYNQSIIEITSPYTTHLDIRLYNISGKEVGNILNKVISSGVQHINVNNIIENQLINPGYYIYRGVSNYGSFSGKILL